MESQRWLSLNNFIVLFKGLTLVFSWLSNQFRLLMFGNEVGGPIL